MKPIQRSALRLKCGKAYYTLKRYMEWLLGNTKFARTVERLNGIVLQPGETFSYWRFNLLDDAALTAYGCGKASWLYTPQSHLSSNLGMMQVPV
jgi:hypothetical protein